MIDFNRKDLILLVDDYLKNHSSFSLLKINNEKQKTILDSEKEIKCIYDYFSSHLENIYIDILDIYSYFSSYKPIIYLKNKNSITISFFDYKVFLGDFVLFIINKNKS